MIIDKPKDNKRRLIKLPLVPSKYGKSNIITIEENNNISKKEHKTPFLTDIELIKVKNNKKGENVKLKKVNEKNKAENDKDKELKNITKKHNNKIKDILKNLDDIDDLTKSVEYKKINKELNYVDMIKLVSDTRKNVKEEVDELTFLLNYVKNTNSKVDRHINGIKNLIKYSGLKVENNNYSKMNDYNKNIINYDEFDSIPENVSYNEYKKIELNKVKSKLLTITGDVIGFHSELRENMKKTSK
jgi:hypothetical protein